MYEGLVLLVEDDSALRQRLSGLLDGLGFGVMSAQNGELALAQLRISEFDAVLLDLNMPGMGGMAACARMRELYPRLSILVLTVRDSVEDRVAALDAGADDYVTKPFRLPELAARIRAAVRRTRQPERPDERRIEIGEISLDPTAYVVLKDQKPIHLTPKEFELLHILMRHAGNPITHRRLLTKLWGEEYGDEREYLRTYISQLRRKLEANATHPEYILTETHVGYRFRPRD